MKWNSDFVPRQQVSNPQNDGILPKGPNPPCLHMADRALWQDNLENYNQMPLFVQAFYCHVSQHKVQMTKMFYVDGY